MKNNSRRISSGRTPHVLTETEKAEKRERNRLAAVRCRQRKQEHLETLQRELEAVSKSRDEIYAALCKVCEFIGGCPAIDAPSGATITTSATIAAAAFFSANETNNSTSPCPTAEESEPIIDAQVFDKAYQELLADLGEAGELPGEQHGGAANFFLLEEFYTQTQTNIFWPGMSISTNSAHSSLRMSAFMGPVF